MNEAGASVPSNFFFVYFSSSISLDIHSGLCCWPLSKCGDSEKIKDGDKENLLILRVLVSPVMLAESLFEVIVNLDGFWQE